MESPVIHEISQEPLEDLLLALELARSSVDLCLESSEGAATVSIRKGRLAGAEFGDRSGSDAVFSVLSLNQGKYQVKKKEAAPVTDEKYEALGSIVNTRLRAARVTGLPKNRSWPPVAAALERTGTQLPKGLSALQLRVLALVDGKVTALDITTREKSSPAETLAAVRSLTTHGLVRPVRAATLSLGTNTPRKKEEFPTGGDTLRSLGALSHQRKKVSLSTESRSPRVASPVHPPKNKPVDTGYSSVPPEALAEERVQLPRSLREGSLTALDEPLKGAASRTPPSDQNALKNSPKTISSALNRSSLRTDRAPSVVASIATGSRNEKPKLSSDAPASERRPSSSRARNAPPRERGPDPVVVAAAEGQLRDSELPLPSSRFGRDALHQLDELNEAVQGSNPPKLPTVEDQEISQDCAVPGSVPRPENLPGASTNMDDSDLPTVGRYEVLARLKRGGMGSVYMCRLSGSAGFRRLFAMKVLHGHLAEQEGAIESFFNEARVLGGMHHRNVVGIADVGTPEQPYIVLDYVEGGSLAELYRASPEDRNPAHIVRIALDALSGLSAAHASTNENGDLLNLVHCDITPHNLLVGVDGTCRVTDFGIARTSETNIAREITRGKPGYLAPERLRRQGSDQRSDIFSLGVVLYAGLTGVEPFSGPDAESTMRNVLSKTPAAPSEVGLRPPASLDALCLKALAKDPNERFQSAEEMGEHLRSVAERSGLMGGSTGVAAWLEEALAPTLAARRTASLRGTVPPEERDRSSTIPPPAEYQSTLADVPSAAEHTAPLEAPPSSRGFNEKTQDLAVDDGKKGSRGSGDEDSKKKPLVLYLAIAAAMVALVWSVLRPDSPLLKAPQSEEKNGKTTIGAIKEASEGSSDPRAKEGTEPDQVVIPEIAPRQKP